MERDRAVFVPKKALGRWMIAADLIEAVVKELDARKALGFTPSLYPVKTPDSFPHAVSQASSQVPSQGMSLSASQGVSQITSQNASQNTSPATAIVSSLLKRESTESYDAESESVSVVDSLLELLRSSITPRREKREDEEDEEGDDSCLCTHDHFDPICFLSVPD